MVELSARGARPRKFLHNLFGVKGAHLFITERGTFEDGAEILDREGIGRCNGGTETSFFVFQLESDAWRPNLL